MQQTLRGREKEEEDAPDWSLVLLPVPGQPVQSCFYLSDWQVEKRVPFEKSSASNRGL